jgi:hypothetical protein
MLCCRRAIPRGGSGIGLLRGEQHLLLLAELLLLGLARRLLRRRPVGLTVVHQVIALDERPKFPDRADVAGLDAFPELLGNAASSRSRATSRYLSSEK